MEIIIPCAGLSSRFPNLRPKYLLTDYSGKMMIEGAAKNFIGKYPVTITILKQHDDIFDATKLLEEVFGDRVKIVRLDEPTTGPADTVYQTLKLAGIDPGSPFLIKDSDGFYDSELVEGNAIYVCNLNKNPTIKNVHAKSYTVTNEQGLINSVVEKQIVSNNFCAGGYQFESAGQYMEIFDTIKNTVTSEIFVSNIIDYMIAQGSIFVEQEVTNFYDLGTAPDWFEYNDRPTYFCDIDGTILVNRHPSEAWKPLLDNVRVLLEEQARDCKLVFTTARPTKFEAKTREMLDELGFKNYVLIMATNHSRRVLINDFSHSNPYPSAVAINLPRNADNLRDYL
jgi:hypothetical protein